MEVEDLKNKANEFLDLLYKKFNCDHNSTNTVLHLAEEVGEIAREINKPNIRKNEQIDMENLKEQIGDVLILVMRLAKIHDINLEKTVQNKIKKIKEIHNL
ncbi:MAG: hypothetical protein IB618_00775 [Candidatus Pacearchaeota archaeon]|nr:MAG: hypothetical protein IB618_00775 [Candidatus Pacearchaeota archaeon]